MKNLSNMRFCDFSSPEMLKTMSWPKLVQCVCQNFAKSYNENVVKFIYSVFCLTTGPKPPPKRFLHTVRSRASSFKWECCKIHEQNAVRVRRPLCSTQTSKRFSTLSPELTNRFRWQNALLLLLKYRMTGKVQSKLQRPAVILPPINRPPY